MDDIPALLKFEQGLIEAERPMNPTIRQGQIQYYDIPALIRSEHIHLVVAEQNDVLIASGYARIDPADRAYLTYQKLAYVGFMYTVPTHRGQGINKLIMATLEQWAIQKGLKEMILEVYCQNENAIRAYEKAGMTQQLVRMRKPI